MSAVNAKISAKYKDSGAEWLGGIPSHWEIKRLKELAFIQNSNVDKKSYDHEISVRLCNYVDVYKNEFIDSNLASNFMIATADESEIKRFQVKKNDVLITKDSETCEDIAIPALVTETIDGVLCGYHLAQIRTDERIFIGPYLSRLFQSKSYGFRFVITAKGITRVGLGQSAIADALTPVPPIEEQFAIAVYLDTKTAQIDRQIDLLGQKATQYGKLKQSLINETVTCGLDKSVPMKDSGVEWIGEVPAHWDVIRGKDIFEQTKNKAGLDSSSYDVLSLTLNGVIKRDLDNMKGKIPASFDGYQITNPSDLVLCLFDIDVTPRIVGYVNDLGIITSAYTVIKGKKNVDMKYFLYYYLEQNRNGSLLANSKTLRSTMTFDLFSQLLLPVPPLEEQQVISSYLDEKTAQIDRIVTAINTQIDKLKDLRKALINDVVTGKIKVVSEEGQTV